MVQSVLQDFNCTFGCIAVKPTSITPERNDASLLELNNITSLLHVLLLCTAVNEAGISYQVESLLVIQKRNQGRSKSFTIYSSLPRVLPNIGLEMHFGHVPSQSEMHLPCGTSVDFALARHSGGQLLPRQGGPRPLRGVMQLTIGHKIFPHDARSGQLFGSVQLGVRPLASRKAGRLPLAVAWIESGEHGGRGVTLTAGSDAVSTRHAGQSLMNQAAVDSSIATNAFRVHTASGIRGPPNAVLESESDGDLNRLPAVVDDPPYKYCCW